jgi:hypothetical protein
MVEREPFPANKIPDRLTLMPCIFLWIQMKEAKPDLTHIGDLHADVPFLFIKPGTGHLQKFLDMVIDRMEVFSFPGKGDKE